MIEKEGPSVSCSCGFIAQGMSEARVVEAHFNHMCPQDRELRRWYDAAFTWRGVALALSVGFGIAAVVSAFKGDMVW